MIRLPLPIALAALVTLLPPGDSGARPASSSVVSYVSRGSEVHYRVVRAPLPANQIGAVSASAIRAVESGEDSRLPPVTGDPSAALARDWISTGYELDGASRGSMPLAGKSRTGSCLCATPISDDRRERVAAIYVDHRFSAGAEIDELGLLELRVSYRDGIAIAINGREVVRRNLDAGTDTMAPATRPRGPELETFFVPVTPGLLRRGENSVRLEVRPSGNRLSPALDFELHARAGAQIVRGPMIQRVGADEAIVLFETDLPTAARLEWGSSAELGRVAPSAGGGLAMRHLVRLTGLGGKPVHYRVIAGADASEPASFHPAPGAGEPIRFAVYGDMRGGHAVHAQIAEAIVKEAPDFVVVTGDLVLRGTDNGDWQRFFAVAADLLARVPYYPVAGNHDLGRSGAERRRMNELFELWPGPADRPSWGHWYSFDVGDVHMVMLDSNAYRRPEQLDWLEKDLAAARKRGVRAIFAATHDGPYSRGIHGGNSYAAANYAPVLARHGVAMLFAGHDHLYQRGRADGLDYIVSGGGGAPLYPVRCGVPGKRRCRVNDGARKAESAFHYIAVQVFRDYARVCARRPNREPLEPCVKIRLSR